MATQRLEQEPKTEAPDDIREEESVQDVRVIRPKRAKLSAEESLKRMEAFEAERMEAFIAAVRKSKG